MGSNNHRSVVYTTQAYTVCIRSFQVLDKSTIVSISKDSEIKSWIIINGLIIAKAIFLGYTKEV